ncbi:cytochrome P450 3A24 [Caerostris extrusa]|uniref:Cytochrome P450 3A24 n=1 Tax=Caerostris extrusa TaxID=172846 RepID=A0AAV4NFK6_CAEEX|nr:cytochrome P450 3A24 [Caerostris extrusa]
MGRLYGHFEGSRPLLSVADLNLVREVLVKEFPSFSSRRAVFSGNGVVDSILPSLRGEDWKRVRSIVSPTFTTGKIRRMVNIIKDCSQTLIENLKKNFRNTKSLLMQKNCTGPSQWTSLPPQDRFLSTPPGVDETFPDTLHPPRTHRFLQTGDAADHRAEEENWTNTKRFPAAADRHGQGGFPGAEMGGRQRKGRHHLQLWAGREQPPGSQECHQQTWLNDRLKALTVTFSTDQRPPLSAVDTILNVLWLEKSPDFCYPSIVSETSQAKKTLKGTRKLNDLESSEGMQQLRSFPDNY